MKKLIIKIIRKIIQLFNIIFKFKNKNIHYVLINDIEKTYASKNIIPVSNKFDIDNNIDLSIVIPVYNAESLLTKCIESIINQKTNYRYNIIFVNDGSTDNSLKILKRYQKEYSNIIVISQENKGIAEARNEGIKHVNGKYIAFIDSDDFVNQDYVELLLNNAYKTNADIVRCNYYEYNVKEDKIIDKKTNQENKIYKNALGKDILKYKGFPWGGIYKTQLWKDVSYPNGYWYEDMIIRMIIFRKAKIFCYINEKLYYYCQHNNNISKSIEKTKNIKCLDQFFLVKELYKLSNKLNIKDDESLYTNVFYEYSAVLWLRTRGLNKKLRKEVFYKACDFISKEKINIELTKDEKLLYKIFLRKDYLNWYLYSLNKMLGVKYNI